MSIFNSSSESENEQEITAHNNFVEEDVTPGLMSCLYILWMLLGLFVLFEYHYQLYYVNVNNNTNNSFFRQNTNDSLI